MSKFIFDQQMGGAPIKHWTQGVHLEESAHQQLRNIAKMPFIHKHVAAMPDVHWGMGATVGSVIATKGAVIPAAVGVDIGCGMMAVRTSLNASDLPDNLEGVRSEIEAAVPHGRTDNGGKNDVGAWHKDPKNVDTKYDKQYYWKQLVHKYDTIVFRHPKAKAFNTDCHLGTLGSGNHFIEICLDEDNAVWIMLHSGSRGPGNRIGSYFISLAKKDMERWFINLPDKDLAYIIEGSDVFKDYMTAVEWAQEFALYNRKIMMGAVEGALAKHTPIFLRTDEAVNCHHNYISRENHFGNNVIVTRKGAVRARKDELGIIPGSMGARSFIVRGLGNPDSFQSCSHGAGRVMSRSAAKKAITIADHIEATKGVECKKDESVLDESPGAYKDIDAVMDAQSDLVEIVKTLKQVVCVKG